MIKICLYCQKEFNTNQSKANFCCSKHRLYYRRQVVTKAVTEQVVTPKKEAVTPKVVTEQKSTFVPNWKLNGFKSKEDAILHVIGCLIQKGDVLKRSGLGDAPSISVFGKTIRLV